MNIIETDWSWRNGLSPRSSTKYIALHHAAAVRCTARQVDEWHKSNGWSGIGYHFFVGKDGRVYRGRPIDKMGAHVSGMNNCSLGICAEGDYDKETEMPASQKSAVKELLRYLKGIYPSAMIVGHKEIGSSDCPGRYFPLDELKNTYMNGEETDMEEIKEIRVQLSELKALIAAQGEKHDLIIDRMGSEVDALKKRVGELTPVIYDYIDGNMPEWARGGVRYCVERGIVKGTGDGRLGLDDKDLRYCTMIMRMLEAA